MASFDKKDNSFTMVHKATGNHGNCTEQWKQLTWWKWAKRGSYIEINIIESQLDWQSKVDFKE